MAAPSYNIPGYTTAPAAGAADAGEPPPRTVAADIRGSRVFSLAAAHPQPGGKE
jgi:hypothetical protein